MPLQTQSIKDSDLFASRLQCPECKSEDITALSGEYTCRGCGLVLDAKVAIYHSPYDREYEQYHRYTRYSHTQIGNSRERSSSRQGVKFRKLQKINQSITYQETSECRTKVEINRLFTLLQLPHRLRKSVYLRYRQVREQLEVSTKFRSVAKLLPPVIYLVHKSAGCPINTTVLIEYSDTDPSDFRGGLLLVHRLLPQLSRRNRGTYIARKISQVCSELGLDMGFCKLSIHFLKSFWSDLWNTSDHVVAGVVMGIAALTAYQGQTSVHRICQQLNIAMSSVQSQVKRKLVRKLKFSGFTSLVNSAALLKRALIKMGLFEGTLEDGRDQSDSEKNMLEPLLTALDFPRFYRGIGIAGFDKAWLEIGRAEVNMDYFVSKGPVTLYRFEIDDNPNRFHTDKLLILSLKTHYAIFITYNESLLFDTYSKKGPPTNL